MQAAKATTISEEAISNIRTVRAFANESLESQRFAYEVNESRRLYEHLGIGIGLFQVGHTLRLVFNEAKTLIDINFSFVFSGRN